MDFIFDRTKTDVEYAIKNQASSEDLKGALNNTDLIRIEYWCKYLAEKLNSLGITNTVTPVKSENNNWKKSDILYKEDLDQIKNNIKILRELMNIDINLDLNIGGGLNYIHLNNMEKSLYDIKVEIDRLTQGYVYASNNVYASNQKQLAY